MKTPFSRIYIGLLLFSVQIVLGQCLVEPLALNNRIQQAENIVEGQVVAQSSFWNETKTHIFTLSKTHNHSTPHLGTIQAQNK